MTGPRERSVGRFEKLDYVDAHFEANRSEYEAMVRSVRFQDGWHVLDAGCGGGGYIPWIADMLGPSGQITALDIQQESIETVEQHLGEWKLPCKVATQVGSFLDLPYPDNSLNAAWCSNSLEPFTDEQFWTVLKGLQRVVKPGGLVAIKAFDYDLFRMYPPGPMIYWRRQEQVVRTNESPADVRGRLGRAGTLRRWFERARLTEVWQKSFLIERWAPDLSPADKQYMAERITNQGKTAPQYDLAEEDLEWYRKMEDADSPENPINDPEFYWCEANTLAVGTVA